MPLAVSQRTLLRLTLVASVVAAAWALLVGNPPARSATAEVAALSDADKVQFFEKQVKPILEASCFKCHGGEAKVKGGLKLTSRAAILHGGDTGPAVSLDAPLKSLLLNAISYKDQD